MLSRGWLAAGEREQLAATIEVSVRDAIARAEAAAAPALATALSSQLGVASRRISPRRKRNTAA